MTLNGCSVGGGNWHPERLGSVCVPDEGKVNKEVTRTATTFIETLHLSNALLLPI